MIAMFDVHTKSAPGAHRPAAFVTRYVIDPALGLGAQFRHYAREAVAVGAAIDGAPEWVICTRAG
jgi:hypothetical protein